MSTLKAARADNFYYAPDGADWSEQRRRMRKTPKKARNYFKSSSLKYADSDPNVVLSDDKAALGGLAPFYSGSGRGTVIRFEMPFKVICLKCGAYIAKGVRFDAERKAIGKYFSTTIYAFLMSCHHCHNPIVIQTDPENTDYICKVGVRTKVETFDTSDANTIELGHDHATKQQLLSNPLFKLECMALEEDAVAKSGAATTDTPQSGSTLESSRIPRASSSIGPPVAVNRGESKPAALGADSASAARVIDDKLDELLAINEVNSGDWYLSNSALRKRFRDEKKNLKRNPNLGLELVAEDKRDIEEAKGITFLSQSKRIQSHFKRILKKDSGIFSRTCASSTSGDSTIEDKRKRLQFIKHIDSRLRRHNRRKC
ncbi:Coiled-coil domain-containing protein -like protein [Babesia sp. Xinjiang]|uniref:Coiled-coil domain-containing protein -like protein n=1 Tax=Babesia sp. Xinjiang TaxID=462227 RepID=UPI000A253C02|nr:Coiled-coil domain-containing protein -like protein [Babesia sp. Xinjiang]ORM40268.1 Coiled-coil domain-containing protein -like protein [Babesia sp. Xinjiang]